MTVCMYVTFSQISRKNVFPKIFGFYFFSQFFLRFNFPLKSVSNWLEKKENIFQNCFFFSPKKKYRVRSSVVFSFCLMVVYVKSRAMFNVYMQVLHMNYYAGSSEEVLAPHSLP